MKRRRHLKKGVKRILLFSIALLSLLLLLLSPKRTSTVIETNSITYDDSKPNIVESLKYRMTYYYTGDATNSGSCTASGKCTNSFQVNDKGWYTYKGMLVVATASTRLGNTNQPTYSLYDTLTIYINDQSYKAIVLDRCGACMRDMKIDLFVSNHESGLDTTIYVIKDWP